MSTSRAPSPTPPEPKALPRIKPFQIIEIERPEELEGAQRPPTNESGLEIAPKSGSTTARYFLMSNISVIVKGNYTIVPARKDILAKAMEPFPDIVKPTLIFSNPVSDIPVEIHAVQDHSVWTVEELHRFLVEKKAPKPHDEKRWAELMGTYSFKETIHPKSEPPYTVRRSAVRFFVNNALLCYAPESLNTKDTPKQAQATKLVVLSLNVSTGPQAMLDHTKSMNAHASGGTYILRKNQPVGTDRNALYQTATQTGVNALVGGIVSGIFS